MGFCFVFVFLRPTCLSFLDLWFDVFHYFLKILGHYIFNSTRKRKMWYQFPRPALKNCRIWCLKVTENDPLRVRRSGVRGEGVQGCAPSADTEREPFLVSSSFWQLEESSAAKLQPPPPSSQVLLLPVSLLRTRVTGFEANPKIQETLILRILNLITTTKTLFSNRVTFTASRGLDMDIP